MRPDSSGDIRPLGDSSFKEQMNQRRTSPDLWIRGTGRQRLALATGSAGTAKPYRTRLNRQTTNHDGRQFVMSPNAACQALEETGRRTSTDAATCRSPPATADVGRMPGGRFAAGHWFSRKRFFAGAGAEHRFAAMPIARMPPFHPPESNNNKPGRSRASSGISEKRGTQRTGRR